MMIQSMKLMMTWDMIRLMLHLLNCWDRNDEVELTDEEFSNDMDEVAEVFRIDTKLFDFETPMCKAFKEFNYILQIDPDLLTKDIEGFKTYEDYKDDWIYEWNKDVPWVDDKPWINAENHEWYEALEDSELKDEALRNKAIKNGFIKDDDNDDDDDDESRYEQMRRWNIYTNYDDAYEINHEDNKREELCEDHEIPVCNIRRYMMINYSFNNNEEYVAVKKDEYNDFTITREEACRACLPRNLSDYGRRMDGPRERNIDEVGGMHIFWNSVCAVRARIQTPIRHIHQEDTAYPCLHSPKTIEDKAQYAVSRETQYAVFKIWNEYNILEDIKHGPYSKKSPIRRPREDVPKENFKFYSNPLFEFDDEYISSDVNPLFDEVLEDIESKDSYVSNLDEQALLVTPLSDANKDECFDPGGEIDEINAFLDMDISTDIENGYHDSEGDIIYLESLLINDTIPNLPPEVFLDRDPKSLKDEPDKDDLKSIVKIFDPGFWENFFLQHM
ncbi:hypothetical protein Tco_0978942 [Tanacetum coccineum]|uniref:Uncharacterized protein n=1 Tax=Tanacetum coccineum TaxID=301880 RepID=A0ABQ5EPI5_9ASTR